MQKNNKIKWFTHICVTVLAIAGGATLILVYMLAYKLDTQTEIWDRLFSISIVTGTLTVIALFCVTVRAIIIFIRDSRR